MKSMKRRALHLMAVAPKRWRYYCITICGRVVTSHYITASTVAIAMCIVELTMATNAIAKEQRTDKIKSLNFIEINHLPQKCVAAAADTDNIERSQLSSRQHPLCVDRRFCEILFFSVADSRWKGISDSEFDRFIYYYYYASFFWFSLTRMRVG